MRGVTKITETGLGFGQGDLSIMPSDLSMMPSNLSTMPSDLSMTPGDLSMKPGDLSMTPSDLSIMPSDLSMMPSDLSMMPGDLSTMPGDLDRLISFADIGQRPGTVNHWSLMALNLEKRRAAPATLDLAACEIVVVNDSGSLPLLSLLRSGSPRYTRSA